MTVVEGIFFWLAVFGYALGTVSSLSSLFFKREKLLRLAVYIVSVALAAHSVAILERWIRIGHGPYITRFEVFSSDVWIIVFFFLVAQFIYPKVRWSAVVVSPVALLMMGIAASHSKEMLSLPPTFRSLWLVVHILFGKLTTGSLVIATALALFYLIKEKKGKEFLAFLPEPKTLDDLSYRFIGLGFLFLGIMIGAGSLWAYQAWGRYWGWDPIETWSLITWLFYGVCLHLRATLGWRGRKLAWLILFAFVFVIVMVFGISTVTETIHTEYMAK